MASGPFTSSMGGYLGGSSAGIYKQGELVNETPEQRAKRRIKKITVKEVSVNPNIEE